MRIADSGGRVGVYSPEDGTTENEWRGRQFVQVGPGGGFTIRAPAGKGLCFEIIDREEKEMLQALYSVAVLARNAGENRPTVITGPKLVMARSMDEIQAIVFRTWPEVRDLKAGYVQIVAAPYTPVSETLDLRDP